MNFRHLRVFVAVYQQGNLTRAAQQLHTTQPAVTRTIQELEREYGLRLFERLNHRLYPTQNGERLYARALHILSSVDELERELSAGEEVGLLRVGASVTLGTFLLPRVFQRFRERYPKVELHGKVANAETVEQSVLEDRLDLGLVEGRPRARSLHTAFLRQDRLVILTPPGHPLAGRTDVTLEELVTQPLLLREEGSAARSFLEHTFALNGLSLAPVWESISSRALINGAASGLGLTILAEQLVQEDLRQGRCGLAQVEGELFRRTNYLVWHEQKYLTKPLRELIQLCQLVAGEK